MLELLPSTFVPKRRSTWSVWWLKQLMMEVFHGSGNARIVAFNSLAKEEVYTQEYVVVLAIDN